MAACAYVPTTPTSLNLSSSPVSHIPISIKSRSIPNLLLYPNIHNFLDECRYADDVQASKLPSQGDAVLGSEVAGGVPSLVRPDG